jgi:hypothetical protein
MEELLHKIKFLEEENNTLRIELDETKEHLKKYYKTHKEELLNKLKLYI